MPLPVGIGGNWAVFVFKLEAMGTAALALPLSFCCALESFFFPSVLDVLACLALVEVAALAIGAVVDDAASRTTEVSRDGLGDLLLL